jgi:hypothetical protein
LVELGNDNNVEALVILGYLLVPGRSITEVIPTGRINMSVYTGRFFASLGILEIVVVVPTDLMANLFVYRLRIRFIF